MPKVELELSIMTPVVPHVTEDLQALLDQFEARHHIQVRLSMFPWATAWADLVKIALYKHGPDVSQIGSTWVSNFVAMNALRPFDGQEVARLGGASAYVPAAWRSSLPGDPHQGRWSIPWVTDTRFIYYRRDLLARAGIDEQTAFRSDEALEDTLLRLQAAGVDIPWSVPTVNNESVILHNLAMWIWSQGGDFVSADGKRLLFNQKEALAGGRAYYALHRYLPRDRHQLSFDQATALFVRGQAAVTIGTATTVQQLANEGVPVVAANVGVAPVPGVPFIGGSNLVVWQHSRNPRAAVDLVRFLTSQAAQAAYTRRADFLPARMDVLSAPPFTDQPAYQIIGDALRQGRAFPPISMWGAIEEKLIDVFGRLWADVLARPDIDLEAAMKRYLDPLAERLSLTLGG